MNPDIRRFITGIETLFGRKWPDVAHELNSQDLSALGVTTETLDESYEQISINGSTFLPAPVDVINTVRGIHARKVRYEQPALPTGDDEPVGIGGHLAHLYPGETVSWDQHVPKIHAAMPWCDGAGRSHDPYRPGHGACHANTCDIHRTAEQIADHEARRLKRLRQLEGGPK